MSATETIEIEDSVDNHLDGDSSVETETHNDSLSSEDNDDVLEGGVEDDFFSSGLGNDHLDGGDGDDHLDGGDGDDHLSGGSGNNALLGGNGTDTAVYSYSRNHVEIHDNGDGTYTVTDGTFEDTLNGVEQISFSDGSMSVDYAIEIRAHQEEIARFYNALFERDPDEDGLAYWVNNLTDPAIGGGGNNIQNIAQAFTQSTEFQALYGANVSNSDFVNLLYQNILHRTADQAGYDYWLNEINETGDRGNMIVGFSNSVEYETETASTIDNFLATVTLNNYILA